MTSTTQLYKYIYFTLLIYSNSKSIFSFIGTKNVSKKTQKRKKPIFLVYFIILFISFIFQKFFPLLFHLKALCQRG